MIFVLLVNKISQEIEGEKGRRQELIDLLQKTAKYVKKFR